VLNPSDSLGKEESVQTEEEEDFGGYFYEDMTREN
jgi:hypothetical protein